MNNTLIAGMTLIISLFFCATVSADEHHNHQTTESFKKLALTESLFLLTNKGGNILVSTGGDGILMVDNGYADTSEELKTTLAHLNGANNSSELTYIINTHWHGDHTGANQLLGKTATIIAHDNVRKRLSHEQKIPLFGTTSPAQAGHALPTLTYPQNMHVHFNDELLSLQHYPKGHTDGDTVVYFTHANIIHMGDLLFYPMFPFIDVYNGGNAIHYADNVKAIIDTINDSTTVIPGHGSATNKAGVIAFYAMLIGSIEEVRAMKQQGLTLTAMQSRGLSKEWNSWKKGFINEATWIAIIDSSL